MSWTNAQDRVQVYAVAKRMCEELGFNPNDFITAPAWKRQLANYSQYRQTHIPHPGAPAYEVSQEWTSMYRWESFIHDASLALAGWNAVNKHMLTAA